MSDEAYQLYQKDRQGQQSRNEARNIRRDVTEARKSPHAAGVRWPFELLQNALDAGPRPGQASIDVSLGCQADLLVFEHDGAPFTSTELAALLSGGSSKEFESAKTTGRFGTGFLVTHVLAERSTLRGVLSVPTGYERFDLTLDRSGDENAILENINSCNEAIRAAVRIDSLDDEPSARFSYPRDNADTLLAGVQAFRRSLPYLYGTRPALGCAHLVLPDGSIEEWRPEPSVERPYKKALVLERVLSVSSSTGAEPRRLRVLRFVALPGGSSAALVILAPNGAGWRVVVPDEESPRIYREYPVRGSSFLPIATILDGKYEVDQKRSRVLMSEADKALLDEAFEAAAAAVSFGHDENWSGGHNLARVADPESGFDPSDVNERAWWKERLARFAARLAQLPLVATSKGHLPAVAASEETCAFPVPRLHLADATDGTTIERILPLMQGCTSVCPPLPDVAGDWAAISGGWSGLRVAVKRVDVRALAAHVRGKAKALSELGVEGDRVAWLAGLLDVVGECWQKRDGIDTSILEGILPNQKGLLASPCDLRRDVSIPEELKDICAEVGLDLRAQLLSNDLGEVAARQGLGFLPDVLIRAVPVEQTENQVTEACLKKIESDLPEGNRDLERRAAAIDGSVRLLDYLWRSRGPDGLELAGRVPLVAADKSVVKWSRERMLMAPVSRWHEKARPFAAAYPSGRVLQDIYGGFADAGTPDVVQALCDWGIAYADPLATASPAELKERRLAAIAVNPAEAEGVTVSGPKLSQIALLQPEVLNRCQEGPEEAAALLGLVLCYIAPTDAGWKARIEVIGHKAGADVPLIVWGALWLADLRFRSWVPVPGDDGRYNKMLANVATLKDLVKPEWLAGNDAAVQLLSTWFGFDQLELRLMGTAPDQAERNRLRDGLAKLVESGGSDPGLYEALAQELEDRRRRSRDVERCRRFGLAVQEAVRRALESRGLKLELVDRGFDYEVALPTIAGDPLTDGAYGLSVGPYLLEIKATTSGEARLTPTQAAVASDEADRYSLCVVDLRGVAPDRLDREWAAEDVEPLAAIVTDIGRTVGETRVLVSAAAAKPVGIRNESALRYEVPESVWRTGCTISAWVARICGAPPDHPPA